MFCVERMRALVLSLLLRVEPAAGLAATTWSASRLPTAAQLACGREAGEVTLWKSVRPRARQTALWELKLFFKAEDDMQRQLGLRGQRDQDDTFGLIAAIAVGGLIASSILEASSVPSFVKVPLGAHSAIGEGNVSAVARAVDSVQHRSA